MSECNGFGPPKDSKFNWIKPPKVDSTPDWESIQKAIAQIREIERNQAQQLTLFDSP